MADCGTVFTAYEGTSSQEPTCGVQKDHGTYWAGNAFMQTEIRFGEKNNKMLWKKYVVVFGL